MRPWILLGLLLGGWAPGAAAAPVVSNAMSGLVYSNLADAVAAAAQDDRLVMIGDEILPATLVVSNRVLTIVSDGAVRTIRGSTNCAYDMILVTGTNATLTLGTPAGSDAAPTLVIDGGRFAGVSNLYDMFFLDLGWLNIHPGVLLHNLASVDTGAINNSAGVVVMSGGRIESNTAPYGGGIFNNTGVVRIQGGTITGNTANVGGGVYNQAVVLFEGFIVGYDGKLDMTGGRIAGNQAAAAGGGIYNMGALELAGGRVEQNSAGAGGGVLHFNGTTYGMVLKGSAVIASNTASTGSGIYYNNDGNTWLSVAEGGRVDPGNDVWLATTSMPVMLAAPLTGKGGTARITPPLYSTNLYVLRTVAGSNLWMVSNYYGKFTVTPPGEPGESWHVGADGRLSHVDPASIPAAITAVAVDSGTVEMAVAPAYVAWDGVVERATQVVSRGWDFQMLPTNAYTVVDGRVVLVSDQARGVFRIRPD